MKKTLLSIRRLTLLQGLLLPACLWLLSTSQLRAQLVINEIMQSNVDCIMQDNQYPDSWVELYNAGKSTEKLSEYKLGQTEKASEASKLYNGNNGGWGWGWGWGGSSDKEIKPGERVLIYCDGESGDQHAQFSLETGKGCMLFLFKNDKVVDQLPEELKKQPSPNIAYGRKSDGSKEWGYMLKTTPNAANTGGICDHKHILPDPVFDIPGKVFAKGKSVKVSVAMPVDTIPNVSIRYTMDGSEPTESSKLYTGTWTLTKSTVIRVKAFCNGWLSPRSVTQSYICMDRDVTLPVFSLTTDKKHFYDSSTGILASANVTDKNKQWRRPVNVEFFDDAVSLDSSVINQMCETRVSGNWTRRFPLRTLAVYAKKRFGKKHFKYEFFPDLRPGSADFKSVLLRNSGNDFPYLYSRDAIMQAQIAKHCDIDWQAGRPAIIFINGEYKGMVNIRERSNDDGIYSNYEGLEDIDMVENWSELKAGNQSHWNDFNSFKNSTHTYDQWSKVMDVEEFMNVMIANIVHCNLDFPGNNICFWRPTASDGRWRVQMKDVDYFLGIYDRSTNTNTSDIMYGDVYKIKVDFDYIKWLYTTNYDSHYTWGNGSNSTALFRNLVANTQIKKDFIDRLAIYMGDFLSYQQTWEDTWEDWSKAIETEIKYHRELYGLNADGYQTELEKAKTWLQKRIPYVYQHEQSYYKLGAVTPLTINISDEVLAQAEEGEETDESVNEDAEDNETDSDEADSDETVEEGLNSTANDINLTFNGIKLSRKTFDGSFFVNRDITLEADGIEGWEITEQYSTGDPVKQTVVGNVLDYKIPTGCKGVSIATLAVIDGIHDIARDNLDSEDAQQIYDVQGRRTDKLQPGINIIKTRTGVKKVLVK